MSIQWQDYRQKLTLSFFIENTYRCFLMKYNTKLPDHDFRIDVHHATDGFIVLNGWSVALDLHCAVVSVFTGTDMPVEKGSETSLFEIKEFKTKTDAERWLNSWMAMDYHTIAVRLMMRQV